jgi:Domain of unknown function (DUF4282)/zinc-ribbon domain
VYVAFNRGEGDDYMANLFCTKCGKQVPENVSSCPSCGHARTGITTPPANPPAPVFASPIALPVGRKAPGFFRILLDTSFNDFITLKLIKFFYILGSIVFLIAAFVLVWQYAQLLLPTSGERIAALLILSPILFIVAVVLLRVYLELVASIFRIAENTTVMAADLNKR